MVLRHCRTHLNSEEAGKIHSLYTLMCEGKRILMLKRHRKLKLLLTDWKLPRSLYCFLREGDIFFIRPPQDV